MKLKKQLKYPVPETIDNWSGLLILDQEIIKCFDGKPLRRLMKNGKYYGIDGKVYED